MFWDESNEEREDFDRLWMQGMRIVRVKDFASYEDAARALDRYFGLYDPTIDREYACIYKPEVMFFSKDGETVTALTYPDVTSFSQLKTLVRLSKAYYAISSIDENDEHRISLMYTNGLLAIRAYTRKALYGASGVADILEDFLKGA